MSDIDVVCIGSAKYDTLAWVDHQPVEDERIVTDRIVNAPGGNANTSAAAMARLGVRVALCTLIGDDAAGRFLLERMEEEGVDTRYVVRDRDLATPQSINVAMGASATRTIITVPAHRVDATRAIASQPAWIHLDADGHNSTAGALHSRSGSRVSVDAGIRVDATDLRDFDLYVPTRAEIMARFPAADLSASMWAAVAAGAVDVVVTDGPDGSFVLHDGRFASVAAFPVDAVSTLGAGDVFHGALLAALVHGTDLETAALWANATAALSCRALDGQSAIPRLHELATYIDAADAARTNLAGPSGAFNKRSTRA
ncbi:PfkB family carbohydrate kinase [Mycobacterium sp. 21AC1]|uniref:carbohydrate kinase family protein n=1 Tax=[Mycobacterium] appelbergii TaxID=2939269 RepID=UPI0029390817|nr:PfkB family carbohydrate kinase [Mycobacterium sp. 21AC1]MDV3125466.1 PfkB family carbohydrate kinase [Mycobacterium sp. 21AC1]